MAVTPSVAAAAPSIVAAPACSAGDRMDNVGTPSAFTSLAATANTNLAGDIVLVIPNNAAIGASIITENFTLTVN